MLALGLFLAALVIDPMVADYVPGAVLKMKAVGPIIADTIGRSWCILYIGDHKDACLMDQRPSSICPIRATLFISARITFWLNVQSLRTNFFDAPVFVALIPIAEGVEETRHPFGLVGLWGY
ncbi:hypothetical protein GV827_15115 [Sulfitobacter sp. JBTF-M27]|uniref:Uncharacterized protein n=1 Tax=Sulfitobacter sediminilitoris TaxID=2698830 RepID=A0A6P0CC17_9RHOB|nr:hypothetical protein [Sulfitobacter sediminilitoris]NEK23729.1 hypothetical protein [Sulfitobacter sediminilitoris]